MKGQNCQNSLFMRRVHALQHLHMHYSKLVPGRNYRSPWARPAAGKLANTISKRGWTSLSHFWTPYVASQVVESLPFPFPRKKVLRVT
eukprot:1159933-Pelagomonas_calceolata.AAC.2